MTRSSIDAPLLRRTRWRLTALSGAATLLTLLVLGLALYAALNASLAASGEQRLRDQANRLQDAVARYGDQALVILTRPDPDENPFGRAVFGGPGSGTFSIVIQPSGNAFGTVPANVASELPVQDGFRAAIDGDRDIRTTRLAGVPVRVLSEPIPIAGQRWVLQVIGDRTEEQRTLDTAVTVLIVGGLAALLAALAVGFFFAGRALVPVRESLRRQREFAADASHELRTPLTVIRSSVEYLRRNASVRVAEVEPAIEDIEAEGDRLARLVDELLLLARADSGAVELRLQPVDLMDVAGDALRGLDRLAAERDVPLQLEGMPAVVSADPDRLRQLIAILVDNAIRHSPRGHPVRVRIEPNAHGALLVVADQGPGIRSEDLPRIFDRFFRAPDAPPGGTGLGLSIARWLAERHGGSLRAGNAPSGGAEFRLSLPARGA